MNLSLSRRGLQSFDASTLLLEVPEKSQKGNNKITQESYIAVKSLDLSHNNITFFTGGQALLGLTILDLSNNSLEQLDSSNLPGGLIRLKVSHNSIQSLQGLATAVPKLQELDIGFNRLSSSNIGDLPKGLTTVICQNNLIDSVKPFIMLQHLSNFDLSSNQLVDISELRRLGELRSLRYLELKGNPIMADPGAISLLVEIIPKLIRLDRTPLSQATENQMFKVNRSRSEKTKSKNDSVLNRTNVRRPNIKNECDMEIKLLETRVKELKRLVDSAEKTEQKLRYQKKILQEQVTACAGVIDSQAMELERLEEKVSELKNEEASLKEPAAELEQTFEQTHASLMAHRLNHSIGPT